MDDFIGHRMHLHLLGQGIDGLLADLKCDDLVEKTTIMVFHFQWLLLYRQMDGRIAITVHHDGDGVAPTRSAGCAGANFLTGLRFETRCGLHGSYSLNAEKEPRLADCVGSVNENL